MNRRNFLKSSGLSAITIALGIGGYSLFRGSESALAINLKPLFDPAFKEAAENIEAGNILASLRAKGVINENAVVVTSMVNLLAKTDLAIKYKGSYYSQTELELYCLAYLIHESDVLMLKGHDLMGGDFDSFKVRNADECLQACESKMRCTGFTYAKPTHPNPNKQNSCWLKDKSVKYFVNNDYISGVK